MFFESVFSSLYDADVLEVDPSFSLDVPYHFDLFQDVPTMFFFVEKRKSGVKTASFWHRLYVIIYLPIIGIPILMFFQDHATQNFRFYYDFERCKGGTASKKEPALAGSLAMYLILELLFLLEGILVQSADGANEILGQILPLGAGGNAVVGISYCGIVLITTGANVFHNQNLLFMFWIWIVWVKFLILCGRRVESHHAVAAWLLHM